MFGVSKGSMFGFGGQGSESSEFGHAQWSNPLNLWKGRDVTSKGRGEKGTDRQLQRNSQNSAPWSWICMSIEFGFGMFRG